MSLTLLRSRVLNTSPRQSTGTGANKSPGIRRDIQGLRALAVLAVIADHLFHWPSGGFIGVDVFFVISGFLITGLLLKEHAATGRISFANFYRRRARRILPLALLVLIATLAVAWVLLNAARLRAIADDALWAAMFSANWRFAFIGTDYMNAGAALSPLQHFWSLAVEEQFYFAWPWILVLVLGSWARRQGLPMERSKRTLGWLMVAVIAISFAWSVWETTSNPTVAYFSTFSRAWELGIGALVALGAGAFSKIPEALRALLAYVGLVGIGLSLVWINSSTPFPGPGALLPVVSTAVVIAAGCGGSQRFLAPLTNRATRYVGDISYSLYLWHFPTIVLGGVLIPLTGEARDLVILGTIVLVSSVSFHLLEDPVRRSGWLESKKGRRDREPLQLSPYPYFAVLLVVTTVVAGGALHGSETRNVSGSVAASEQMSELSPVSGAKAAEGQQSAKVTLAINTTSWPDLVPTIEDLGPAAKAPEWVKDGCLAGDGATLTDPIANATHCTYGDQAATKTAVVLGDSVSISYVPGIRAALEPQGFKINVYTMQQCPAVKVEVLHGVNQPHAECDPFRRWTFDKVRELKPDLVIMSSAEDSLRKLASGATGQSGLKEWADASKATFLALAGSAKRLMVLDPPPVGKTLQECATKLSTPQDCGVEPGAFYDQIAQASRDAVGQMPVKSRPVFVTTKSWFCSRADWCPPFVDKTPVYADGHGHLSSAFSSSLGPVMAEAFSPKDAK